MPSRLLLSAAAALLAAGTAFAESVPYSCTILDDGMAVRINVSNPATTARSCLVSCRFATSTWAGESQVMCAHMVPAGAKDVEMCTRSSGGVQFLRVTHGTADCVRR